jgi:hypothetical protein
LLILEEAVEVLAVVLELAAPPCRQPLTVILSFAVVLALAVVVVGVCAVASADAHRIAAAMHTVRFICHLVGMKRVQAGYPYDAASALAEKTGEIVYFRPSGRRRWPAPS